MKILCTLLLLTLLSCNISKHGVFLDEMATRPIVLLKDNILTIKTTNSIKNSALLIYKINISTDKEKKQIFISADQVAGKEIQDTFTINLTDYKIKTPVTYSYFWLDPDKKATKLDLTEK